jgi:hypothetical protein
MFLFLSGLRAEGWELGAGGKGLGAEGWGQGVWSKGLGLRVNVQRVLSLGLSNDFRKLVVFLLWVTSLANTSDRWWFEMMLRRSKIIKILAHSKIERRE